MTKQIYADFNNSDADGNVRLNAQGTRQALDQLGLTLADGLRILLSDGELTGSGVVRFSEKEEIWVAEVDWNEIS